MNILIIGCGQLGARLANILDSQGHDIAIIGSNEALITNLDENFSGVSIPGSPIDADIMKSAGIEGCNYVICATESDNANIMAAQIIKNTFNIENVFVRVLDPVKCETYREMGLITISPTSIVFESIYSKIFNSEANKIVNCGNSSLSITTISYEKWMKGKTLKDIEYVENNKLIGFSDEQCKTHIFTKENYNFKIKKNYKLIYISIVN